MSLISFRRMRRYPLLWWALVALVAGATGFVVTTSVASAQSAASKFEGMTNVSVMTHAMPAGSALSASDVRTEARPRAFLSAAQAVLSPVGRTLTAPVAEGDVVTELNAGGAGLSSTAALVHADERAVTLSLQGLHPTLVIGDRVDVLATFDQVNEEIAPTTTVSSGARVVQLNEDSVMVAVPVADAPKVAFAATKGEVVLALSGQPAGEL